MNKELISNWCDDLESGRYKQGRKKLRQRDLEGKLKYCCLGVLLNRINRKEWRYKHELYLFKDSWGVLPSNIRGEIGLTIG